MEALRIVHASDIHLHLGRWTPHRLLPGVHQPRERIVKALATGLGAALGPADESQDRKRVGVLSGDLSLLGGNEDIDFAMRWWQTALPTGVDNLWVLGNHDFWGASVPRTFFDHRTLHEEVRARYPHQVVAPMPVSWTVPTMVRWYQLDSTPTELRTNLPAKGKMYATDRRSVLRAIASDRDDDVNSGMATLSIVVMHHPRDSLRDKDTFNAEIGDRADLILVGHTHRTAFDETDYGMECVSPSSTLGAGRLTHHRPLRRRPRQLPGFLVHDLTDDGSGKVVVTTAPWEFKDGVYSAQPVVKTLKVPIV